MKSNPEKKPETVDKLVDKPELKEKTESHEIKIVETEEPEDLIEEPTKTDSSEIDQTNSDKEEKENNREFIKGLPKVWQGFALLIMFFTGICINNYGIDSNGIVAYSAVFLTTVWWSFAVIKTHKLISSKFSNKNVPEVESVKSLILTKSIHVLVTIGVVAIGIRPIRDMFESSYAPMWMPLAIMAVGLYWLLSEMNWAFKLSNFISCTKSQKQYGANIHSLVTNVFYAGMVTLINLTAVVLAPLLAPFMVLLNNMRLRSLFDFKAEFADDIKKKKIVRYRKYAAIEQWFIHRFTKDKSKYGLPMRIFLLMITPVLIAGGFYISLSIIFMLPTLFQPTGEGGVTQAINAEDSRQIVAIFLGMLFTGFLGLFAAYRRSPTHIEFNEGGLKVLRQGPDSWIEKEALAWDHISEITINNQSTKAGASDSVLIFHRIDGQSPLKINLSSVPSIEEKQDILTSIERYAPTIKRSSDVILALQLPAEHSYTELWLQALSAPPKREKLQPLQPGALVRDGRYRIQRKLGVGGQGFAYLATDNSTEETVVLKEFILPVFVDINVRKAALEQFESEAKILSKLDHPQIVKLEDFMVEDHRAYLVLEHIDGMSLRERVKENGPLSEEEVQSLAKQMCTVLEHLHSQSPPVVHRDFTPDNLILNSDGTLKLIDFNVAQQSDSTTIAKVVGKQSYLPTEQFQGKPCPQSDIYAMGCTLNYLLTGEDPVPISQSKPKEIVPSLSQNIDSIVAKATKNSLADRYQSAQELAQDLDYDCKLDDSVAKEQSKSEEVSSQEKQEDRSIKDDKEVALDLIEESETDKIHLKEVEEEPDKKSIIIEEEESEPAETQNDQLAPHKASALSTSITESSKSKFKKVLSSAVSVLIVFMILVITSWFLLPGIRPYIDDGYKQHLLEKKIDKLYRSFKYKSSIKELDKIVDSGYKGLFLRKRARYKWFLGQKSNAIKDLRVLNDSANDSYSSSMLGIYLISTGDTKEAKEVLDKSVSQAKSSIPYLVGAKDEVAVLTYFRGIANLYNGSIKEALNDFERSAAMAQNIGIDTNFATAVAYGIEKNASQSIEYLRAINFNKQYDFELLGPIHDTDTLAEIQLELLTDSQKILKSNQEALNTFSQAIGYLNLNQHDKAMASIDKVISLAPELADAYSVKADILIKMGKSEEAKSVINKALSIEKENAYAICLKAYLAKSPSELNESINALFKVVQSDSVFKKEARYLRASLYEKTEQYPKAFRDYAKCINHYSQFKKSPKYQINWPEAKLGMLRTKLKLGDHKFVIHELGDTMRTYTMVKNWNFVEARMARVLSEAYKMDGNQSKYKKYRDLSEELGYSDIDKYKTNVTRLFTF